MGIEIEKVKSGETKMADNDDSSTFSNVLFLKQEDQGKGSVCIGVKSVQTKIKFSNPCKKQLRKLKCL